MTACMELCAGLERLICSNSIMQLENVYQVNIFLSQKRKMLTYGGNMHLPNGFLHCHWNENKKQF